MFNWEVFGQIWAIAGIGVAVTLWAWVTIGCAIGIYKKRFQIIWGIFSVALLVALTILTGFLA